MRHCKESPAAGWRRCKFFTAYWAIRVYFAAPCSTEISEYMIKLRGVICIYTEESNIKPEILEYSLFRILRK